MGEKTEFKSLTRDELVTRMTDSGETSYRADQILDWVFDKRVSSFGDMSNLPQDLRERLESEFELDAVRLREIYRAEDATEKFLFELGDGSLIETVLIPATPGLTSRSNRRTVCVSTQVGCAYRCGFCASGLDGVKRNLSPAEIVDQIAAIQRHIDDRVENVVVMGMGEPLANYDNLMRALAIINAPWGLGIGARKITVSTVGLVPRIRQLASEPMQIRLAVSLHGATDDVRVKIMPVNSKYPLSALIDACRYYRETKGRMMTFEYILIDGVNDSLDQANHLSEITRDVRAKVNLIPYNEVAGLPLQRPTPERCKAFQKALIDRGVSATLRREKGDKISAACGQLRLQHRANHGELGSDTRGTTSRRHTDDPLR